MPNTKVRLTLHIESLVKLAETRSITFKHPSLEHDIELVLGSDIGKLEYVIMPMSDYVEPKHELKDMD